MMLIFDIGYIHSQNGEDLSSYIPQPYDGLSFYEVKDFTRDLPDEYERQAHRLFSR